MIVDKETGDVIRDYDKNPLTDSEIGSGNGEALQLVVLQVAMLPPQQLLNIHLTKFLSLPKRNGLVAQNEDIQAILDDPDAWLESRGLNSQILSLKLIRMLKAQRLIQTIQTTLWAICLMRPQQQERLIPPPV